MIVHIVILRVRDDLSDAERREFEGAAASLATVPGVQSMTWGPDVSGRGKGFTHAAVMHFADRETLGQYLQHPQHLAVLAVFDRLVADKLVIDYEMEISGISA